MKTRIFIGSSSEGLKVANYVKHKFNEAGFEPYVWTDNIFQANNNTLETLLNEASLFDFGIMIATKDDFTEIRDDIFETVRDNVVFEFGLFLGRLGVNRAFALQEKEAKLPSDLLGITIPRFDRTEPFDSNYNLNKEIDNIIKIINGKITLGELGLLPSTVLAIGYFENFVSMICDALQTSDEININGKLYSDFKFNIVIPKDLDADIKKRAKVYFKKKKLQEIQIDTNGRSFPIHIQFDEKNSGDTLILFDMPTTLVGIDKAIEMYMRKAHIGKTEQQQLLEDRELRNFKTTIINLVNNNAFTKDTVMVIDEI
ncbi:STING domain-containing protein [Elizabethkingia anophelis]|uniref:CBASS system CD-NTase-associated NAD(+) hydrolase Cap12 n=1 Tax=Elizabethkingia anophelis TaxID=1117645 RepID=UPI000750D436|nr:STING domain-containing protein [Elizabethkingia anophelis]AQW89708.1 hypothetical protein BBD28_03120 [Elizabethkingia anophelis]KUY16314.1 hypothetical protein ATB94_05685 [Elizabethkingia anophelis]MCT3744637.1 nucleotide-binding protein [Elizabethkingia anophelis]MDC8026487.1 nucleotide-binding protein [Elizabethkingia anophelis]MDV3491324.1 hypothetical protein [Elizabethkingia anophelis]